MDQVKKVMKVLFAQRFWIIVGIVTLVPLGGWYTTTAAMRKTTDDRKKLIDSKFKEAQTVSQKVDHPNDTSHEGMEKKGERLKQEIKGAWEFRYAEQEKMLVWPDPLGDAFKQAVQRLNPIERVKFPTPPADEISIRLRERYRDYIQEELPKLAEIIDAKWVARETASSGSDSSASFGGFPGAGSGTGSFPGNPGSGIGNSAQGAAVVDTSKVIWDESDQMMLRRRYDWQSRPDHAPKTLDVLYAQEDLWLMTALMNIFAETNQGATARYNAVVKEIKYISIGAAVGGSVGNVMRVTSSSAGSDGGLGMPGGGLGMPGGGMPYGAGGAGGSSAPPLSGGSSGTDTSTTGAAGGMTGMAASASPDPANNRYVNVAYTPISADTLRKAIDSDAQNENEAYLLVAKRIPVRLGITIDQRKLHRFITACGNSKLMIEVRQVRFNRQGAPNAGGGGFGGSGGMGGMGGAMGGMGGPMGGMGGPSLGGAGFGGGRGGDEGGASMPGFGGMSGSDSSTGALPKDMTAHDKPVEIYGIVYIYNPVDVKKLKYVEAAQPAEPAAPANKDAGTTPGANGTTPAANPATNPTTPAANPTTPAANPTTPAANPTTPAANPATPSTNPATPAADSANPAPASNPTAPASNPAGPASNPTGPSNPGPPSNPATPAGSGAPGTGSTAPAPNQ